MVIRGKQNLPLEALTPEGCEITSEKSRNVNRKKKQTSSEIQLNSIIQNKKTKEQKIYIFKNT